MFGLFVGCYIGLEYRSHRFVGCWIVDRVEMILPQVHLRNGECCGLLNCYATPGATMIRTPSGLSSSAFPRLPSSTSGSAFAGVGLNVKQAHALCRGTPIPSLTVSERSPFDRRFAADCPLVHPATLLPSTGSLPLLLRARLSTHAAVVAGFRASPNSLG